MSDETSKDPVDLRSIYGLACPECGFAESFTIDMNCSANLTVDGTEPRGDHYWDDTSSCFCDECGHNGLIGDFRVADAPAAATVDEVQP